MSWLAYEQALPEPQGYGDGEGRERFCLQAVMVSSTISFFILRTLEKGIK